MNPARSYVNVTPSDTAPQPFGWLWIGGTGNVTIRNYAGQSAVFDAVPSGTELRVSGQFVMASGTTATNIVACN